MPDCALRCLNNVGVKHCEGLHEGGNFVLWNLVLWYCQFTGCGSNETDVLIGLGAARLACHYDVGYYLAIEPLLLTSKLNLTCWPSASALQKLLSLQWWLFV